MFALHVNIYYNKSYFVCQVFPVTPCIEPLPSKRNNKCGPQGYVKHLNITTLAMAVCRSINNIMMCCTY